MWSVSRTKRVPTTYSLNFSHALLVDCCPGKWQITLAGSRFLSLLGQSYTAIEGEALAVVWDLEQTHYFTQGCNNLTFTINQKPLVKIFGDCSWDEITNRHLFLLKQYKISHLPCKFNHATNAALKHPSPSSSLNSASLEASSLPHLIESTLLACIHQDNQDLSTIFWSLITQKEIAEPPPQACRTGGSQSYLQNPHPDTLLAHL